jgi:hypothetical protein
VRILDDIEGWIKLKLKQSNGVTIKKAIEKYLNKTNEILLFMDKDRFVEKLKEFKPLREVYERLGFAETIIEKKVRRFERIPLTEPLPSLNTSSEVLNLLSSYDCSNIEIGILTFLSGVREVEDHYIIGEVEADLLAVSKITLEVQVLDYLVPTHIIWDCAANGERFLDSLTLCAEYFFKTYNNSALAENTSFAHEYAIQSAEKAGGEKYVDFYQLLLGDW